MPQMKCSLFEEPTETMDVLNQGSCRNSNIHCIINEIHPSVPDLYVTWLAYTVYIYTHNHNVT